MLKLKKKMARILSLILMISMLMSNGTMASATEITDNTVGGTVSVESSSVEDGIGEITNSISDTEDVDEIGDEKSETLEDEDSLGQVENTEEANTDETVSVDTEEQFETSKETNPQDQVEDEYFYRDLESEEVEEKEQLSVDTTVVANAKEGEDFVKSEVIYLCDTKEDAEEAAKAYSEATGYTVKIKSFSYGVAVFSISGSPKKNDGYASANSVQRVMNYAADMTNNLPAVYPNYIRQAYSVNTSNEESFSDPFLKTESEMFQWYHEMIHDKPVFEGQPGVPTQEQINKVTVAVLDTGIDSTHSDFSGVNISSSYTIGENGYDGNGHGTNVAGIIGAAANNIGGRGVASGVRINAVKVLGDDNYASDDSVLKGLIKLYKENGTGSTLPSASIPQVVNMSLGGSAFSSAYLPVLEDLHKLNVTIVAAAGNDYIASAQYPAAYDNVIAVAALNNNYEKAQFSNYGPFVDIAAPGGDGRVYNGSVEEQFIWSTGSAAGWSGNYCESEGGRYCGMYGTSQATPVVSAAAALLYAQNSNITPDEVEARLKQTASPVKGKYNVGAGCVNIEAALGIDETVPEPVSKIENDIIDVGTNLEFNTIQNATVYYTLDGNDPNLQNVSKRKPDTTLKNIAGTFIYDWNEPLKLLGAGKITVKAVALLYGKTSKVATFNYTYKDSQIERIELSTENEFHNVGIGKKISIKADILPSYAQNKKVTWSVDDSSVAIVDSNGVVTGLSEGEVTIRATATDGSEKYGEYKVYVKPLVKTLSISTGKIVLNRQETYSLPGNALIHVYPTTASQEYIYTSAKPAIATIDNEGVITAKSSGTTTITVTAADGSGKKDIVIVEVHTLVESMHIEGENGFNKVAVGKSIIPKVTFNAGGVKPDNTSLRWSYSYSGAGNVSINELTGVLTIGQDALSGEIVTVTARTQDGSGLSEEWKVTIYPLTEDLSLLADPDPYPITYKSNIWDISYYYYDDDYPFIQVQPNTETGMNAGFSTSLTLNEYAYKSSNPKVVKINNQGDFEIVGKGTSKITITALDGSGKSLNIFISGYDASSIGIESPEAHNVLYPGKSINFKLAKPTQYKGSVEFFTNQTGTLYRRTSYLSVSKLKVSAQKNMPKNGNWPRYEEVYPKERLYLNYYSDVFIDWNRCVPPVVLEIYPYAVNSVQLSETALSLEPHSTFQLTASALPELACQKYFTYTSSNPKVATVDSNGKITAIANGKATITVLAGDGSKKKATCTVTVAKLADSLEVTSKNDLFGVASGKSLQLVAKVDPGAANKKVIYTSSDTNVATVNASGKVTAKNVTSKKFVNISVETADGAKQKDVSIGVYPAVTGINVYDSTDSGKNNPLSEVKLSSSYFNGLKQNCTLITQVLPYDVNNADKSAFDFLQVTSSNPNIVTATNNYSDDYGNQIVLEAVGPGTANVKLAAMDGSGKSATIKVTVLSPVTEITIAPKTNVKALTPGKSLQLVATTNKDATNKKVTWSVEGDSDWVKIDQSGKLTLTATKEKMEEEGLYRAVVKAEAQDGSGICKTISIPCQTLLTSKLAITDGNGDEIKTLNLCLGNSPGDNNALMSSCIKYVSAYDASDNDIIIETEYTVQSSNIAVAKAYDNGNNSIALIAGTKAGTATITVTASDGSNKKTSIKVNVVDPVRKIAVKSATDGYYMARGTSLSMKAVTNANATNKKVKWSLENAPEGVTIDTNGNLKAALLNTPASVPESVEVVATATDGGGVFGKITVNICNKANSISSTGVTEMSLQGGEKTVSFGPTTNTGTEYSEYLVSYTTGAAKVRYDESLSNGDGTSVIVTPIKKGKVTITATAQDGSKMSVKHTIEIVD